MSREKLGLYPFQKEVVERVVNHGNNFFALFWDVGVGKTPTSLHIAKFWQEHRRDNTGNFLPVYIITPKSLIQQWKEEIIKWGLWTEDEILIIKGSKKKRMGSWNSPKKINITNYETVRSDKPQLKNGIVVIDEASKIKNGRAKLTKTMKEVFRNFQYKLALTATPYETHPSNLYNIMNFLSPTYLPYKTFYTKYVEWEWNRWAERELPVRLKNIDELKVVLMKVSDVKKKEEVRKDLPPLTTQNRFVELTPTQKKVMGKLLSEEEMFHVFTLLKMNENNPIDLSTSTSEKVLLVRELLEDSSEKDKELINIIEEINGNQTLIFSQFKTTVERLGRLLKKHFPTYNIQTTCGDDVEKDRKVEEFKNKKIQILITTDTLAYGLSFPDVDYLINYDILYNPAKLHQRVGRVYRITSQNPKTIINLIGGGVEREAYEVLKERGIVLGKLLDVKGVEEREIEQEIWRRLKNKR